MQTDHRPVYLDPDGRPTLRRPRPAPFVARWQDGATLVTLAMGQPAPRPGALSREEGQ